MNWFRHDTDATQDAKLKKLLIRHGAVGYAIYFHCLELIAAETSESNLTFELEHDSEIIADNLHIKGTGSQSGIQIVEQIMRDIVALGLFAESEGRIFCFKLLKRLDSSMTSNPKFRQMIIQARTKNHDGVMTPSCNQEYQPRIPTKNNTATPKSSPRAPFRKPTIEEVTAYCLERGKGIDPAAWYDHYEGNGWMVGRVQMRDWKATVRTWERTGYSKPKPETVSNRPDAWTEEKLAEHSAEMATPRTAEEIAEVDRLIAANSGTPAGRMVAAITGRLR